MSFCPRCEAGKYNEFEGKSFCEMCPSGTKSEPGSTSCVKPVTYANCETNPNCESTQPCLKSSGFCAPTDDKGKCAADTKVCSKFGNFKDGCSPNNKGETCYVKIGNGDYATTATGGFGAQELKGTCKGDQGAWFCDTSVAACQPGTVKSEYGRSCIDCPLGTFSSKVDQQRCSPCAVGTFSETVGAVQCTKCPEGYSSPVGATTATFCTKPTTDDVEVNCEKFDDCDRMFNMCLKSGGNCQGATASGSCPSGSRRCTKYAARKTCPVGSFVEGRGCQICPMGHFSNVVDAKDCMACAKGTYATVAGTSLCRKCPAGKTTEREGSFMETFCEKPREEECYAGQYISAEGKCNDCERGKASASKNSRYCMECPVGLYADQPGTVSCKRTMCPANSYADVNTESGVGSTTTIKCQQCPATAPKSKAGSMGIVSCVREVVCCKGETAGCEACRKGMTLQEFCAINKNFFGCGCTVERQGCATDDGSPGSCFQGPNNKLVCGVDPCLSMQCKDGSYCESGKIATFEGDTWRVSAECKCPPGMQLVKNKCTIKEVYCTQYSDCRLDNPCLKRGGNCAGFVRGACGQDTEMCTVFADISTGPQCPGGYDYYSAKKDCAQKYNGLFNPVDCVCGQIGGVDTCPVGMAGTATSGCISCKAGQYAGSPGAKACSMCVAGKLSRYEGSSSCTLCKRGYASKEGSRECDACAAGKSSRTAGSSTCEDCPTGTYGAYASSLCEGCTMGQYAANAGSIMCVACEAGKYSDVMRSTSCKTCAAGKTSKVGDMRCIETGSASGNKNTVNCFGTNGDDMKFEIEATNTESIKQLCENTCSQPKFKTDCSWTGSTNVPAGSHYWKADEQGSCQTLGNTCYSSDGVAGVCRRPATATTAVSAIYCHVFQTDEPTCPTGGPYAGNKINDAKNKCLSSGTGVVFNEYTCSCAKPTPCPAGKYSPDETSMNCELCWEGTFAATSGTMYECNPCKPGTAAPNMGAKSCMLCKPGTSAPAQRAERCEHCPGGQFSATTGAKKCTMCEAGKYSDVDAATKCRSCIAGTFGANTGAYDKYSCELCAAGMYSDKSGASMCEPCLLATGNNAYVTGRTKCEAPKCCKARTADCLACEEKMDVKVFCALPGNSGVFGCSQYEEKKEVDCTLSPSCDQKYSCLSEGLAVATGTTAAGLGGCVPRDAVGNCPDFTKMCTKFAKKAVQDAVKVVCFRETGKDFEFNLPAGTEEQKIKNNCESRCNVPAVDKYECMWSSQKDKRWLGTHNWADTMNMNFECPDNEQKYNSLPMTLRGICKNLWNQGQAPWVGVPIVTCFKPNNVYVKILTDLKTNVPVSYITAQCEKQCTGNGFLPECQWKFPGLPELYHVWEAPTCGPGTQGTPPNCNSCPAGYESPSGEGCSACPAGTFTSLASTGKCMMCEQGKFNKNTGSTSCTLCAAGSYMPRPGAAEDCYQCPRAMVSSVGAEKCKKCNQGMFAKDNVCQKTRATQYDSEQAEAARVDCSKYSDCVPKTNACLKTGGNCNSLSAIQCRQADSKVCTEFSATAGCDEKTFQSCIHDYTKSIYDGSETTSVAACVDAGEKYIGVYEMCGTMYSCPAEQQTAEIRRGLTQSCAMVGGGQDCSSVAGCTAATPCLTKGDDGAPLCTATSVVGGCPARSTLCTKMGGDGGNDPCSKFYTCVKDNAKKPKQTNVATQCKSNWNLYISEIKKCKQESKGLACADSWDTWSDENSRDRECADVKVPMCPDGVTQYSDAKDTCLLGGQQGDTGYVIEKIFNPKTCECSDRATADVCNEREFEKCRGNYPTETSFKDQAACEQLFNKYHDRESRCAKNKNCPPPPVSVDMAKMMCKTFTDRQCNYDDLWGCVAEKPRKCAAAGTTGTAGSPGAADCYSTSTGCYAGWKQFMFSIESCHKKTNCKYTDTGIEPGDYFAHMESECPSTATNSGDGVAGGALKGMDCTKFASCTSATNCFDPATRTCVASRNGQCSSNHYFCTATSDGCNREKVFECQDKAMGGGSTSAAAAADIALMSGEKDCLKQANKYLQTSKSCASAHNCDLKEILGEDEKKFTFESTRMCKKAGLLDSIPTADCSKFSDCNAGNQCLKQGGNCMPKDFTSASNSCPIGTDECDPNTFNYEPPMGTGPTKKQCSGDFTTPEGCACTMNVDAKTFCSNNPGECGCPEDKTQTKMECPDKTYSVFKTDWLQLANKGCKTKGTPAKCVDPFKCQDAFEDLDQTCLEKRGMVLEQEYKKNADAIRVCLTGDATATGTIGCPNAGQWVEERIKELTAGKCDSCAAFAAGSTCSALVESMMTGTSAICWGMRSEAIKQGFPGLEKGARCATQEVRSKDVCYARKGKCIDGASTDPNTCSKMGSCDASTTCCFVKETIAVYTDFNKKQDDIKRKLKDSGTVDFTAGDAVGVYDAAAEVSAEKYTKCRKNAVDKSTCEIDTMGGLVDPTDIAITVFTTAMDGCTASAGQCALLGVNAMDDAGFSSMMAADGEFVEFNPDDILTEVTGKKAQTQLMGCIDSKCKTDDTQACRTRCWGTASAGLANVDPSLAVESALDNLAKNSQKSCNKNPAKTAADCVKATLSTLRDAGVGDAVAGLMIEESTAADAVDGLSAVKCRGANGAMTMTCYNAGLADIQKGLGITDEEAKEVMYNARVNSVCKAYMTCAQMAAQSSGEMARSASKNCDEAAKVQAEKRSLRWNTVKNECEAKALLTKTETCNRIAATSAAAAEEKERCGVETERLCQGFRGEACGNVGALVEKTAKEQYTKLLKKCKGSADQVKCRAEAKTTYTNSGGDATANPGDVVAEGVTSVTRNTFQSCMDDEKVRGTDKRLRLPVCKSKADTSTEATLTDAGFADTSTVDNDIVFQESIMAILMDMFTECNSREKTATTFPTAELVTAHCKNKVAEDAIENGIADSAASVQASLDEGVSSQLNEFIEQCTKSSKKECRTDAKESMRQSGFPLDDGALVMQQASGAAKQIAGIKRQCIADVTAGSSTEAECDAKIDAAVRQTGLNIDPTTALHEGMLADIVTKMEGCHTSSDVATCTLAVHNGIIAGSGFTGVEDKKNFMDDAREKLYTSTWRQCRKAATTTVAKDACLDSVTKHTNAIFGESAAGTDTASEGNRRIVNGVESEVGSILSACPDGDTTTCIANARGYLRQEFGDESTDMANTYIMNGAAKIVYVKVDGCIRKSSKGATPPSGKEIDACCTKVHAADTTRLFPTVSDIQDAWEEKASDRVANTQSICMGAAIDNAAKDACDAAGEVALKLAGVVQPGSSESPALRALNSLAGSMGTCLAGCKLTIPDPDKRLLAQKKCEADALKSDNSEGSDVDARIMDIGKQGAGKTGAGAYMSCKTELTAAKTTKVNVHKECMKRAVIEAETALGSNKDKLAGDLPAIINANNALKAFEEFDKCVDKESDKDKQAQRILCLADQAATEDLVNGDDDAETVGEGVTAEKESKGNSMINVFKGCRKAADDGASECIAKGKKPIEACLGDAMDTIAKATGIKAPEAKDEIKVSHLRKKMETCVAGAGTDATKLAKCDKDACDLHVKMGGEKSKCKERQTQAANGAMKDTKRACLATASSEKEKKDCQVEADAKFTSMGGAEYERHSADSDVQEEIAGSAMGDCVSATGASATASNTVAEAATAVAKQKICRERARKAAKDLGCTHAESDRIFQAGVAKRSAVRTKSCVDSEGAAATTAALAACNALGDKVCTDSGITNEADITKTRFDGATKIFSDCNKGCQRTNKVKTAGTVDINCDAECSKEFAAALATPANDPTITSQITEVKSQAEGGVAGFTLMNCMKKLNDAAACDKDGESAVAEFNGKLTMATGRRLRRLDGLRALQGTSTMVSAEWTAKKINAMVRMLKDLATGQDRHVGKAAAGICARRFKNLISSKKNKETCDEVADALACIKSATTCSDTYSRVKMCEVYYCCPLQKGDTTVSVNDELLATNGAPVKAKGKDFMGQGETDLHAKTVRVATNTLTFSDGETVTADMMTVINGMLAVGGDRGIDELGVPKECFASVDTAMLNVKSSDNSKSSAMTGCGVVNVEDICAEKNVKFYTKVESDCLPAATPGSIVTLRALMTVESEGCSTQVVKKKCFSESASAGAESKKAMTVVGRSARLELKNTHSAADRKSKWRTACDGHGNKARSAVQDELTAEKKTFDDLTKKELGQRCMEHCTVRDDVILAIDDSIKVKGKAKAEMRSNRRFKKCRKICKRRCRNGRFAEVGIATFINTDDITVDEDGEMTIGDNVEATFEDGTVDLKGTCTVTNRDAAPENSWGAVRRCRKDAVDKSVCKKLARARAVFSKMKSSVNGKIVFDIDCSAADLGSPVIETHSKSLCFQEDPKTDCSDADIIIPSMTFRFSKAGVESFECDPATDPKCESKSPVISTDDAGTATKSRRRLSLSTRISGGDRRLALRTNTMALSVFVDGVDASANYDLVLTANGYVLAAKGATIQSGASGEAAGDGLGGVNGGETTGEDAGQGVGGIIGGVVGGIAFIAIVVGAALWARKHSSSAETEGTYEYSKQTRASELPSVPSTIEMRSNEMNKKPSSGMARQSSKRTGWSYGKSGQGLWKEAARKARAASRSAGVLANSVVVAEEGDDSSVLSDEVVGECKTVEPSPMGTALVMKAVNVETEIVC